MPDPKLPARHSITVPSVLGDVGRPDTLPAGNHWFGLERDVIANNTTVVDNSTGYLHARRRQSEAYVALIDARMRIAEKIAELTDLPHRITDQQDAREHARFLAQQRRALERQQAAFDQQHGQARNAAELARLQEQGVRAVRNLEAAHRVKDSEIGRWEAEAEARRNNAEAERQDAYADLHGAAENGTSDTATSAQSADRAVLDHEIELERQRGNEAGVRALLNLKARLGST